MEKRGEREEELKRENVRGQIKSGAPPNADHNTAPLVFILLVIESISSEPLLTPVTAAVSNKTCKIGVTSESIHRIALWPHTVASVHTCARWPAVTSRSTAVPPLQSLFLCRSATLVPSLFSCLHLSINPPMVCGAKWPQVPGNRHKVKPVGMNSSPGLIQMFLDMTSCVRPRSHLACLGFRITLDSCNPNSETSSCLAFSFLLQFRYLGHS